MSIPLSYAVSVVKSDGDELLQSAPIYGINHHSSHCDSVSRPARAEGFR
jgi:hypothetical protein